MLMVRRASTEPRSLPEQVTRQATDLAETQRAAGRGSTALRDTAGNALVMNPDAPYPLLRAQGIDSAVAFGADGTVRIVSPDTQEHRDLAARGGVFDGHVGVAGQVEADTIGTNTLGVGTVNAAAVNLGPVHLDGNGLTTPGVNAGGTIGCQTVECRGTGTFNDVGSNHIGCGRGDFGDLSYHQLVPPPSERALKRHDSDLDDALEVVRRWVPARWRWADPPTLGSGEPDERLHASLYVDEIAETAPELVVTRADTGRRTYDDRAVVAYLVAVVQQLAERIETLEAG